MKFQKTLFIILFSFAIAINAQEKETEQTTTSGTIENQFDYLINKSNKYKNYKVVKRESLFQLKKAVNDSLNLVKKDLKSTKIVLKEKEIEITTLTNSLSQTKKVVVELNNQKDSINFFGMLISKPVYNTTLWTIIGVFFAALLFFIFKFNNSNTTTKEINNKFLELEKEYEDHRQRSLEREQQIRRKLQEKLNKHKKDK